MSSLKNGNTGYLIETESVFLLLPVFAPKFARVISNQNLQHPSGPSPLTLRPSSMSRGIKTRFVFSLSSHSLDLCICELVINMECDLEMVHMYRNKLRCMPLKKRDLC